MSFQAFVEFNVEPGHSTRLATFLEVRPEVKEVHEVFGLCQVLAKVKFDDLEKLKAWPDEIKTSVDYIRSTRRMILRY